MRLQILRPLIDGKLALFGLDCDGIRFWAGGAVRLRRRTFGRSGFVLGILVGGLVIGGFVSSGLLCSHLVGASLMRTGLAESAGLMICGLLGTSFALRSRFAGGFGGLLGASLTLGSRLASGFGGLGRLGGFVSSVTRLRLRLLRAMRIFRSVGLRLSRGLGGRL